MTRTLRFEATSLFAFISGETDLTVVVQYHGIPGRKATLVDPAEEPSVEIESIQIFNEHKVELLMHGWLERLIEDDAGLHDSLMQDWAEQVETAAGDAADDARPRRAERLQFARAS